MCLLTGPSYLSQAHCLMITEQTITLPANTGKYACRRWARLCSRHKESFNQSSSGLHNNTGKIINKFKFAVPENLICSTVKLNLR